MFHWAFLQSYSDLRNYTKKFKTSTFIQTFIWLCWKRWWNDYDGRFLMHVMFCGINYLVRAKCKQGMLTTRCTHVTLFIIHWGVWLSVWVGGLRHLLGILREYCQYYGLICDVEIVRCPNHQFRNLLCKKGMSESDGNKGEEVAHMTNW